MIYDERKKTKHELKIKTNIVIIGNVQGVQGMRIIIML